jgi:hypothetical protein
MPAAAEEAAAADYRAVIYLCATEENQLDDAERRCREYAGRFGWHVLESIRDHGGSAGLDQLLSKVSGLGVQIIVTDTLDMISPDQGTRDNLMMAIERSQCIVHPVSAPSRC